jgi:membrane protein implicated in regulation of membrane protease activity
MFEEFILQWGWLVWLGLILVFIIIEVTTLEFTFLMLGIGSLGGLVAGLLGLPWWAQIVIAAVLAVVLLFLVRPALLRALRRGGDPALSNVDALLGLRGTVVKEFADGRGQVKLGNGETWTSRLADPHGDILHEGEKVVVQAIEGATAVVVPVTTPETSTSEKES